MIEIEAVLREMDAIDHEHSSGRLWWGLLRDWLKQQQAAQQNGVEVIYHDPPIDPPTNPPTD